MLLKEVDALVNMRVFKIIPFLYKRNKNCKVKDLLNFFSPIVTKLKKSKKEEDNILSLGLFIGKFIIIIILYQY
jgi:hypothetical protein